MQIFFSEVTTEITLQITSNMFQTALTERHGMLQKYGLVFFSGILPRISLEILLHIPVGILACFFFKDYSMNSFGKFFRDFLSNGCKNSTINVSKDSIRQLQYFFENFLQEFFLSLQSFRRIFQKIFHGFLHYFFQRCLEENGSFENNFVQKGLAKNLPKIRKLLLKSLQKIPQEFLQ